MSSHPPPNKANSKSAIERNPDRRQKKQKAFILKNINHNKTMLNEDIAEEKLSRPHQVFLDRSILLLESPGNNGRIAIINIEKYANKPINERGISVPEKLKKVPHGLFKTLSQPLLPPGHERDPIHPHLWNVIEPVSMAPIVDKTAIEILAHLEP